MFEASDMALESEQPDGHLAATTATASDGQRHSLALTSTTSRLSSSYKTAREHLISSASNSTLAGPAASSSTLNASSATLTNARQQPTAPAASVRRRRSSSGQRAPRPQRPRSEIVQSLIERADARIKHLYTPYFHANNQQVVGQARPTYANDPLLGQLGGHRMFERTADKSKRHTIHQTMTYYNLYFSEEQRSLASTNSGAEDADETVAAPAADMEVISRPGELSSGGGARTPASLSAALCGIREGSSICSSGPATLTKRRPADLASLGEAQQSSESQSSNARSGNQQDDRRQALELEASLRRRALERPAGSEDDNTSLSFSAIVEFEEDDMLQYSSPTEPRIVGQKDACCSSDSASSSGANEEEEEEAEEEEQQQQQGHRMQVDEEEEESAGRRRQNSNNLPKCLSSGYDSASQQIYSSNASPKEHRINCRPIIKQESPSKEMLLHSSAMPKTATSSTTADSLALTTMTTTTTNAAAAAATSGATSDSNAQRHHLAPCKSLPSSPPGAPRRLGESIGQLLAGKKLSFVSRSSRHLFGRSKRKPKTRYWQLCMFVMGGKQNGTSMGPAANEPISIWRLYI